MRKFKFPDYENRDYADPHSYTRAFSNPGSPGMARGTPSGRVGVKGQLHPGATRMLEFSHRDGMTAKGYGCVGKPDPAQAPVRCPDCRSWVWVWARLCSSHNRGKHLRERDGRKHRCNFN